MHNTNSAYLAVELLNPKDQYETPAQLWRWAVSTFGLDWDAHFGLDFDYDVVPSAQEPLLSCARVGTLVHRRSRAEQQTRTVHCSPFTVHRSPFTVHWSPFTVHRHRSPFTVHRSPFTVRRSPFTVNRSLLTVHRSPCTVQRVVHRSPCTVQRAPFTIDHASFTVHR